VIYYRNYCFAEWVCTTIVVASVIYITFACGKRPLTGEQVRWGLENLDITADRLKQLGFGGVLRPIKVSCADHEGARVASIGRSEKSSHGRAQTL
jgi:hypothetical protein